MLSAPDTISGTTLLRDIQTAATEANESVSVLLRKCKVLAARLDHPGFAEWVEWELNGYPSGQRDLLPDYRRLRNVEARGNFSGGFGAYITNGLIPKECIERDDRDLLFSVDLAGSVAEYEALVTATDGDDSSRRLTSPWPTGAVIKYADRIWEMHTCTEAWRVISRASVAALLDAIRNRVLSFALEIERENSDAGDASVGAALIPRDKVDQVYNFTILGGSQMIATGDVGSVLQMPGLDWEALRAELESLGLPQSEVQNLGAALTADRQSIERGELGPATQTWLGKITAKIETGAMQAATGASGGVIAQVLVKALGIG